MHYVAQGQKRYPDADEFEALCLHAEGKVLTANTARVYKQNYLAALEHLAAKAKIDEEALDRYRTRIEAALNRRRGKPSKPRTSSKKVKDPEEWMVLAVFEQLKRMALRYRRLRSMAVALHCLLVPKLGVRTVELVGARIEGDHLVVRNAKRRTGEDPERRIGIANFHATHKEALRVLVEVVAADVGELGYDKWLSNLAEILATACKAASRPGREIPRLAPSAFRHIALSTWHSAGYSAEEIARLAGHLSIGTARRHYIRKSSAFPVGRDLVEVVENVPGAAADVESSRASEPDFMTTDFPRPAPAPEPAAKENPWLKFRQELDKTVQATTESAKAIAATSPEIHGPGRKPKPKR